MTKLTGRDAAPIRVLEVVDTLDAGGMEAQLVALMNRLDPQRFQFEVCCLRHAGVHAASLNPGIPVHALQKAEGFQWQVVRQLRGLLSRGFDVVHTHNLAPLIYAALATAGGARCPILHGEHSQLTPQERGAKRLWQRRVLYRCCAAVHTVSAGQRQELLNAGLRHPRLTAIVNGVNTDRFRPCEDTGVRASLRQEKGLGDSAQTVIGIVARFGAFKRHAELIRAFEKVLPKFPSTKLVLVGSGGPCQESVLAQIAASSAREQIHWAGYQSDPAPWYQMMDLLVVPSLNEGLSNATLEAMASGVPVLSNAICGARESIQEGAGGWIRDLTTDSQIEAALREVLRQPKVDREQVGKRGQERAAALFSWQRMADVYGEWFAACAKRAPFPPSSPG